MSKDHRLQEAVLAELAWEPSVVAAQIGVTARNGVVTLTGFVESYSQKLAAEQAALRVRGVQALAQEIDVRLPFERQRGDEEIATAAIERLSWSVGGLANPFTVKVEDGWITLTGDAEWHFQKDEAAQDVRQLMGVVGVSNNITVKPCIDAAHLTDDINHALGRSWFFDTSDLRVTAAGGHVVLTGTVSSQHDRQSAARTAWAASGTVSVANDIIVT